MVIGDADLTSAMRVKWKGSFSTRKIGPPFLIRPGFFCAENDEG